MARMGKYLTICLVIILAIYNLITLESVSAQKLSAPTFKVNLISGYNKVPTTYSTDPYTGTTITKAGYTVNSMNISLTIDNLPTTSFYLVQVKGHYAKEWFPLSCDPYNITAFSSSGRQTIFTLLYGSNETSPEGKITFYFPTHWKVDVPLESQLDIRLQAVSGKIVVSDWGANYQLAVGEASDWSNIQTISIPDGSVTISTSLNPTPTVPEFPITISLVTVLAAVSLLLVIGKRRMEFSH